MELLFLGTSAAEGIPAIFCDCRFCRRAAKLGGRDFRTRSSLLVDRTLKIDLPPDTYHHKLTHGLDLNALRTILITHSHFDHFSASELEYLNSPFSHWKRKHEILFLGNEETTATVRKFILPGSPAVIRSLRAFETARSGGFTVTAVPAVHSTERPLNYVIRKSRTTLLYASDTGPYPDSTIGFLSRFRFDAIVSECTGGLGRIDYGTHMALSDVIAFKRRMEEAGASGRRTRWLLTHFSHNGSGTHTEMAQAAKPHGLTVAWDGLKLRV